MSKTRKSLNWKDLIEQSNKELGDDPLVEEPPKVVYHTVVSDAYYGITINPPRVKRWVNLCSGDQRVLLSRLWTRLVKDYPCAANHVFEYCKDGQVHLHGWIHFFDKHVIIGFISDIAKFISTYWRQVFRPASIYHDMLRYRSPCVCVQYYADISQWKDYMSKQQDKSLGDSAPSAPQ